jgi:hypothetical protein
MNDPKTAPLTPTSTETGGAYADTTTGFEGTRARPEGMFDTNAEETYWRQNYTTRPYVTEGTSFTEYKPAYRYGADAHTRYPGRSFDEAESELGNDWDRFKGTSSLTWDQAKHAARDAWQRVKDFMERAMPGDADRDGK